MRPFAPAATLVLVSCLPEPTPEPPAARSPVDVAIPAAGGDGGASAVADDDKRTASASAELAAATKGLPAEGTLVATIKTNKGDMRCRLYEDKAPLTVANFVGLARGVREWKEPGGNWVKRPLYDGTTFHRVIKGFMIQGGDPLGNGSGEPGYTIPDEIWPGAKHDRAGQLCMANRGPNTNGAQFFITDAAVPNLDVPPMGRSKATYTIFGECEPVAVVHAIASVPTGAADRPKEDVVISTITVDRVPSGPAPQAPPSSTAPRSP